MNLKGKNKYYLLIAGIAAILVFVFAAGYYEKTRQKQESAGEKKISEVGIESVLNLKTGQRAVAAVGTVEALDQVEIKSQAGGEVKKVNVKIGDSIKRGQILLELDHAALDAQLNQAKAAIDRAENALDQREAGASQEQIEQSWRAVEQSKANVEQVKVSNETTLKNLEIAVQLAKTSLDNTGKNADQGINNAYSNLRINIKNNLPAVWSALIYVGDILGKEPGDINANSSYRSLLGVMNSSTKTSAENSLALAKISYDSILSANESLSDSSGASELEAAADLMDKALGDAKDALTKTRLVLDNSLTGSSLNEAVLSGMKAQIDGYNSSIGGAISSLEASRQAIANAKLSNNSSSDANQLAYEKALQDLDLAKKQTEAALKTAEAALAIQEATYKTLTASPREVDLSGLKASIKEAKAAYSLTAANRDKAIIKAPFDGTISAVAVKSHDLANAGQSLVSLVNLSGLQVSAFVSEKDRLAVAEGNQVKVAGKIEGVVSRISPSLDPVTKKIEIIIAISDNKAPLAIGQAVEAEIFAGVEQISQGSYLVPLKAVTITQSDAYVLLFDNGKAKKATVGIGAIEGAIVEITEGLSDDDQLIIEGARNVSDGDEVKSAE